MNRGSGGTSAVKSGPADVGKGGPANVGKGGPTNVGEGDHTGPAKTVRLSHGGTAKVDSKGRLRSVDKNGMHIEHNLHGERTVVSEHNGRRVVTTGKNGGYVQRPYVNRGGHSYYARTTYDHGVARSGVYRGYNYGGHTYYGYQPAVYYSPAFYGWAASPWPGPLHWDAAAWGWGGTPWFAYYGFAPYPSYAGPAFWLTDYLIAANLQAAYAEVAMESPAVGGAITAPASLLNMPPTLNQCENGVCGTWTWDGAQYNAQWSQGSIATISVVSWDGSNIVLNRVDTVGASPGATSTYTGRLVGPSTISGTEVGSWPGHFNWNANWNATSPTPILPPSPPPAAPAAVAAGFDQVTLTPDVKQAIVEEAKSQIGAEQAAAGQNSSRAPVAQPTNKEEVPPALDPARRTFVVSADLAVNTTDGQECSLTQGDVIMRMTDTPDADQKVNVSVSSSKKKECAAGKMVAVSVDDLQEMRNHFEEQCDAGMKAMAAKQGTGGMPKAPDTTTAVSNLPFPLPDSTAAKDLQAQQAAADQAEAEVKQETASATAPAGGQM